MFSDDGCKLYLDDKVIIDLDGLHAWAGKKDRAGLIAGEHEFHLSYMQGPPTQLGLQLWVTPPGEKEKIFRLQDFSKALADGRRQLQVTEDDKEIRVKSCVPGTRGEHRPLASSRGLDPKPGRPLTPASRTRLSSNLSF